MAAIQPIAQFDTHEVFNQPPPFEDVDLFSSDRALVAAVRCAGGDAHGARLAALGRRVGIVTSNSHGRELILDLTMKQALFVVDVQPSFPVPIEIVRAIRELSTMLPSVATVERHDESVTPFERQLGWRPGTADESLVAADRVFIKHGYLPPAAAIDYLRGLQVDRVLVCGTQADTCVLAAGFALFDAGLHPTLLKWLTVGSSLDRSGDLGALLWEHHFGRVLAGPDPVGLG